MSTEIERRVGNLLNSSSQGAVTSQNSSVAPSQGGKGKPSSSGINIIKPDSFSEIDSAKENLSLELKQRQEKMKVHMPIWSCSDIDISYFHAQQYSNYSSYLLEFL